ncbi:hypothetical protein LguiB_018644 [Lonicera macranthoides]
METSGDEIVENKITDDEDFEMQLTKPTPVEKERRWAETNGGNEFHHVSIEEERTDQQAALSSRPEADNQGKNGDFTEKKVRKMRASPFNKKSGSVLGRAAVVEESSGGLAGIDEENVGSASSLDSTNINVEDEVGINCCRNSVIMCS